MVSNLEKFLFPMMLKPFNLTNKLASPLKCLEKLDTFVLLLDLDLLKKLDNWCLKSILYVSRLNLKKVKSMNNKPLLLLTNNLPMILLLELLLDLLMLELLKLLQEELLPELMLNLKALLKPNNNKLLLMQLLLELDLSLTLNSPLMLKMVIGKELYCGWNGITLEMNLLLMKVSWL